MIHHFILTRFSITLWTKDKNGSSINRAEWLRERISLFETYCLPSVKAQECKDFTWVLMCDREQDGAAGDFLHRKMEEYKAQCPQIRPVWIKRNTGRAFASIFRNITLKLLFERKMQDGDLCLTTYLDNDDMLHPLYVQQVQKEALALGEGNAISYDYGLQYFTDLGIATRISYPNNHFMTFIENVRRVRTCYGYGSHFLLEKTNAINVCHINNRNWPMWVEVIHEGNVDNDVKMTLDTTVLDAGSVMADEFGLHVTSARKKEFYRRCMKQILRRMHDKIIPRKWE
ncbi:MAG: putative rhamnosyl transferase [Bacteroidales bacterium]|nr:putative rhamnosyl transferase [Bacteroidales bacterium]MCM1147049.1 putative rhamnosyl transferase [Bacteroidales bacterium]MCM1205818.1 putative rhamnosyl transferase [Bacillota bacterium]MCM1509938.1 putative rhamnosyl transferase [Clostridium sp.]